MYTFNELNIIATIDITTLLTPLVKEAIESAVDYQIDEYRADHYIYRPITPPELTVFIVPLMDDHLIMIRATDPASDMLMIDSLNEWLKVIKEDHEIWGDDME